MAGEAAAPAMPTIAEDRRVVVVLPGQEPSARTPVEADEEGGRR